MERRWWFLGTGLVLILVSVSSVQAVSTPAPPAIRAEVSGRPIPLADVARFHCHDLAYPLLRCFLTSAERDADEAAIAAIGASPDGAPTLASSSVILPYVRWYLDANSGGPSFDASVAYSDLRAIGWNDKISSFLTYAGGHPRWWRDVGFTPVSWDWGVGVSVPYVGDAVNDQFSSVERL